MDTYQYSYGDRPLEGYTIQRAAGRGGFGEVYYAVSDSGRQVALKAIQSYEQIELRGISQCMNLKSPHLVTVFDVKYNDKGRPFVIMEYVSGPSLSDLLKETPGGLGAQKAAFFLREIGKGLSYLHECGIVHRDLKPSNIFYENGYVKIGDYGLTKAISASRHVSHTITVGTVHYMAPEIGAGRYDRSVDIYALGILLYEMLTGQVPFLGSSPAEILMKHMTAAPDLSNIDEPFARVIRRALAKDPAERYQTVQEMVEDVFGTEHVRNSVSQFAPEELSVVAQHVAQEIGAEAQHHVPRGDRVQAGAGTDFSKEIGKKAELLAKKAEQFAKKAEVLGGQMAEKFKTAKERAHRAARTRPQIADPLRPRQRYNLSLIATTAVALGAGFLSGGREETMFTTALVVFIMVTVASRVILRMRHQWWEGLDPESRWLGKAATCFLAAFLAALVGTVAGEALGIRVVRHGGPHWPFPGPGIFGFGGFIGQWGGKTLAFALPMLLVNWWKATDPQRSRRVLFGPAVGTGFLGLIAGGIFGVHPIIAACTLAGVVLVVQTLSPWGRAVVSIPVVGEGSAKGLAQAGGMSAKACEGTPHGVAANGLEGASRRASRSGGGVVRYVPAYARPLWFVGWLVSLGGGLMLTILAATGMHGDDFAITLANGIGFLVLSLLCFVMMFRRVFTGWYRYLIRPLLLVACVPMILLAAMMLASGLSGDEEAIAIFFIVFPSIAFLALLFTPARMFGAPDLAGGKLPPLQLSPSQPLSPGSISPAKRLVALLLAVIGPMFGICGLQRFYVGKIGHGILWLFTWGLLGIGQLIDIILIAVGQFKDRNGLPLVAWQDGNEMPTPVGGIVQGAALGDGLTHDPSGRPQASLEGATPRVEGVQAEKAPPQPAAYQPPSWPSYASTGSVYEPWNPIGGLLAAVGHILALAALLIGLTIGLHLPAVAAAAWPNEEPVEELTRLLGSEWPAVAEQVGTMLIVLLLFLGAILIMLGRRKSGPGHLLRALLGLGGFFWAIQLFRSDAISTEQVQNIVDLIRQNQVGPALQVLFSAFSQEEAIFAGVIVLASVLVLSWPPRRRTAVFGPLPNQGVVL